MATGTNPFEDYLNRTEKIHGVDDDDWFFDSIRRYKSLYMYNLQYPVTAMGWIENKGLCVATRGRNHHHELIELSLPETLWNPVLSKDRDFGMAAGGFSSSPVSALLHVPNTRYICTSPEDGTCSLHLWSLATSDTDVMQMVKEFSNSNPHSLSAKLAIFEDQVLFGSHMDNLSLVDVSTLQVVQDPDSKRNGQTTVTSTPKGEENNHHDNAISYILWKEPSTAYCCLETGDVHVFDIRTKLSEVNNIKCNIDQDLYWTMDIRDNTVVLLSSGGDIVIRDLRNNSTSVISHNIGQKTQKDYKYLTVKVSQEEKETYSVSGFDGNVYIYSAVSHNEEDSNPVQPIETDFIHEGHTSDTIKSDNHKVVTHVVHPTVSWLYLSAATDGSLHAWQRAKNDNIT